MYKYISEEVISNLYEGVYIVDHHRKIVFWNAGSEYITGYKAEEVLNKHCYNNILKHVDKAGNQLCIHGCPLKDTLSTGNINENEVFLQHKSGYRVPISIKTFPLYDDNNQIIAAVEVFTDIKFKEEHLKENEELKRLVRFDELTNLYNRRYLNFLLTQSYEEAKQFNERFSILFIDIDHFKDVNDQYGHDVGDDILIMVANTLKSNMRPNDVVGRWGGEEFIAIIKTNNENILYDIAEKLRKLTNHSHLNHNNQPIQVSISIGGALYQSGESVKELIQRADKKMYISKMNGRNQVTL